MKKIPVFLFLLFACSAAFAQDSFSSVEERMTGREFKDTGLAKLTDAELEALNKWLRDHSVATLKNATVSTGSTGGAATTLDIPADRRGLEGKLADTRDIVSHIVGEFSGWEGETTFTLENGMVWKQDQTDKYFTKPSINPMVTIKQNYHFSLLIISC